MWKQFKEKKEKNRLRHGYIHKSIKVTLLDLWVGGGGGLTPAPSPSPSPASYGPEVKLVLNMFGKFCFYHDSGKKSRTWFYVGRTGKREASMTRCGKCQWYQISTKTTHVQWCTKIASPKTL